MPFAPVDISQIKLDQPQDDNQALISLFPSPDTPDPSKFVPVDISTIKLDAPKQPKLTDAIPKKEAGFIDRVGQDLSNRWHEGQTAAHAYNEGQQSMPETLLQTTGKVVAGSANDIIGEGVQSVWNAQPDAVQDVVRDAGNELASTKVGQAVGEGVKQLGESYQGFAKDHPRAARNIESVADLAAFIPAAKPLAAGTKLASQGAGTVLRATGDALVNSADASALARRSDFAKELIAPKETPTVRADQFGRSAEKGILRKRVVQPTPQESAIIDTVSQLPVSPNKSLLANYNIIEDANSKEAEALIANLKANDVPIGKLETEKALGDTYAKLKQNPFITGDAEKAAQRVGIGLQEALNKNPKTASGLLQARKDFDSWVKSQKGSGAFDPARDSPVTIAVQQYRQAINDLVESKVPNVGFKASLQKQSHLYRAMDNIETKGGYEGKNMVSRGAQKLSDLIPVKGAVTKGAVLLGGAGAAAAAPAIVGGGAALYGAGKLAASPAARKAAGRVMQGAGGMMGGKKLSLKTRIPKP